MTRGRWARVRGALDADSRGAGRCTLHAERGFAEG